MNSKYNIYLDNAATTKPNEEVVALNVKLANEEFANPNSVHHLGIKANNLLDKIRILLLKECGCINHNVIFTSSSTEALNLAIKGYALNYQNRGKHIITSNIEHPSVSESIKYLKDYLGFEVTTLEVNNEGVISLDELRNAINDKTILVSIMAVNNEVGSINNVKEIANIVHKYPKCAFLCDTTQAITKEEINYNDLDMFVISSHKIHGLKNSGALIYKKNLSFVPVLSGGGQEYGYRSGTVSLADAASLVKALQIGNKNLVKNHKYVESLNKYLREQIKDIDGIRINSSINSSPYIFNFSLMNKKAAVVVEALSNLGIYVSSVSACHSKKEEPSFVINALTGDTNLAKNTIRISFSESNTTKEIDILIKELKNILENIR